MQEPTTHSPDAEAPPRRAALLLPRRLLRWMYTGRLSLALAIFIAALFVAQRGDGSPRDLAVAGLALLATAATAAAAFAHSEIYRRPLRPAFLYTQTLFDLLLVTVVVHLTGGGTSQFAALYILVIVVASLLLPAGGSLLVAALGNVLYFGDVVLLSSAGPTLTVWLQLGVFALVALGSAWIGARLQEAGQGREELEAELLQVRLHADDILENIRSGVLTVDEAGRLRFANPAAGALLELDLARAVGQPVLARIAARAPELADTLVRAARDGERTTRGEGTITTETRRIAIGVTTTASRGLGEGSGAGGRTATAIFSDISEGKRLEQLRLRAERLEGIASLSASLAHEIKNPLAAVRSAVEQLARMPQATDDSRTLTSLVVRESDRLSRFLSEFMDFTRVRVRHTTPVDAAVVARGAVSLAGAHPDCPEGVVVEARVPEGEPLTVQADEDLLHRAVFNLLLNALQAVSPGGRVQLEVGLAPRGLVPQGMAFPDGGVFVRVSDDGPGIPTEVRDRLFEPFFTTKPGGSGLGLAVVQRAVEAHRGFVQIDSPVIDAADGKPARGTRVAIVLPRARAQTPLSTPAQAVP